MDVTEALQFERDWEARTGSKPAAIRARFGIPAARYYVHLYTYLDDPETVAADPLLVRRLIRLRNARAAQRASRLWHGATKLDARTASSNIEAPAKSGFCTQF